MHRRLLEQRAAGRAVLLVSLELEEIRALADRVLVIYDGQDRRRAPAGRERRGAGRRHDRRRARRGPAGPRHERSGARRGRRGPGAATVASRLSGYLRGGGIITPLVTVVFAFFVAGLVIAVTGGDPLETYKAIFNGSGLNWFFPWISAEDRTLAALNLQQTLLLMTP